MRPKLPFAVFESLDEHFLAFEEGLKTLRNAWKFLEIRCMIVNRKSNNTWKKSVEQI
jgi:hypothetical protein